MTEAVRPSNNEFSTGDDALEQIAPTAGREKGEIGGSLGNRRNPMRTTTENAKRPAAVLWGSGVNRRATPDS